MKKIVTVLFAAALAVAGTATTAQAAPSYTEGCVGAFLYEFRTGDPNTTIRSIRTLADDNTAVKAHLANTVNTCKYYRDLL